jgi:hypothetical protein
VSDDDDQTFQEDRECTPLTNCTFTEYVVKAATSTADRVCTSLTKCCTDMADGCLQASSANEYVRGESLEYESSPPRTDAATGMFRTNRVCAMVSPPCADDEYESKPPTARSDRECVECTSSCKAGYYHPLQLENENTIECVLVLFH